MVPVAHDVAKIGDRGEHREPPEVLGGQIDGFAVDRDVHGTEELHAEASSSNDDVGVYLLTRIQLNAIIDDAFDGACHDGGATALEAFEVVAVRAIA
jgi:hypothetical protein